MTTESITLRYEAREWQGELHAAMADHMVTICVAHRRSGKSVAAAATLCMAALAAPGRYGLGSTTKTQLKLIYWHVFKDLLSDVPGVEFAEGEVAIRFPNGSEILFFGLQDGDGQSVRGTGLSGFVLDEAQLIPEPAFTGAIRPALTDKNGWLLVIGTPAEPSLLGQLYEYATTAGDPGWAGLHFPVDATGVFTPAQIGQLRAEALNEHAFRQEFDCVLTAQDQNKLLSLPHILAAAKRSAGARVEMRGHDPVIVAVDVGGDGLEADKSAICVRKGVHVLYLDVVPPEDLDNLPLLVAAIAREYRADVLLVDGTGGHASALTYRLGELGYVVIPVIFAARASRDDLHANKRAEMYARLANFLKRPDAVIPSDRALIRELGAITYRHDTRGRLLLEPKAKVRQAIGHSPDRADALAMSMLGDVMAPYVTPPVVVAPRHDRLGRPDGARYQSAYRRPAHLRPDTAFNPFGGSYDPFC
jgi:hypothetical protein